MKKLKLYFAMKCFVDGVDIGHVTLCFMDASKTSKLFINEFSQVLNSSVLNIDYWERPNVTVLTIKNTDAINLIKSNLEISGFTYNLEFIPHVTMCSGDNRGDYSDFVGKSVLLKDPYIRLSEF